MASSPYENLRCPRCGRVVPYDIPGAERRSIAGKEVRVCAFCVSDESRRKQEGLPVLRPEDWPIPTAAVEFMERTTVRQQLADATSEIEALERAKDVWRYRVLACRVWLDDVALDA